MSRALLGLLLTLAAVVPASAQAAGPAATTISGCKLDRLTVAGKVAVTGKAARKVRGANLQLRLAALPLFGLPQTGAWRDLGRKTKGSGQQEFTILAADNWVGVMSWRFRKGSRTLLSRDERSQAVKAGGSKGQANCTLSEGAKPPDTTPPALFILPADDAWHRAPAPVQLLAKDDFSGVKSVRYSLDGGPITEIRNGSTFNIGPEGAHNIQWAATDVAGNSASRSAAVKVDAAPPTKPALARPFSVTASTTPQFQWSASTDSGSGLKGYFLAIRRADGSLVALQPFDAATTSAPSPAALGDGQTYTAVVTAVDNTDNAWTTDSDPLTFRVDTSPEVTATDPADGAVLTGSRKSGNLTVSLDRPADPATVTAATVSLQRDSGLGTTSPIDPPSCSSPCTTIAIHPTNALPEGRYTLAVNGVKSQEGATIAAKAIKFAVPDANNELSSLPTTSLPCLTPASSQPLTVLITHPTETVLLSFSYVLSGGVGQVTVKDGSNPVSPPLALDPPGGTPPRVSFSLSQGTHAAVTIEYCVKSGSGNLSLQNVWVSRAP